MNNTNTNHESRDFYLSGYLVASGEKLIDYWRSSGITTFIFKNSDRLNELIRTYYSMDATVNPIIYGQSLKNLKSIIYSNENTNEPNPKNGRDK